MPYDPYAGGWTRPSWWAGAPGGGYGGWGWEEGVERAHVLRFLNEIMPMMRTQQDMLELARFIGSLGNRPGYAAATTTTGQPLGGGRQLWAQAVEGSFPWGGAGGQLQRREAAKNWLRGLWSLGQQYGMTPAPPGGPKTATRGKEIEFRQAFGQALERAPSGYEALAPWMQKLFMPTVSRPRPGSLEYDQQTQQWRVRQQPRFY